MNFTIRAISALLILSVSIAPGAHAWDGQGHELAGSIADQLIVGTRASEQVQDILGYRLREAATWPDCVRGVRRSAAGDFTYKPGVATCAQFETPAEVARMEDYARRNWTNCPMSGGRACHTTYHFADVAIERDGYSRADVGTGPTDIVSAIDAATDVLQDRPAPAPFSIADKKEALLMLAHFVGDLHQPLHVGAVYLLEDGSVMDPDVAPGQDHAAIERNNATRGGNSIRIYGGDLHSLWDHVPEAWGVTAEPGLVKAALATPSTEGPVDGFAATWAGETVRTARQAFQGLSYGPKEGGRWPATPVDPAAYRAAVRCLQEAQIAKAGARLAELLERIWPEP